MSSKQDDRNRLKTKIVPVPVTGILCPQCKKLTLTYDRRVDCWCSTGKVSGYEWSFCPYCSYKSDEVYFYEDYIFFIYPFLSDPPIFNTINHFVTKRATSRRFEFNSKSTSSFTQFCHEVITVFSNYLPPKSLA